MAELAVISLVGKILSTIASPAFKKAYEKGVSIREAKDELDKLKETIETIQAALLDAEKKKESSAVVKNWIKRLKGLLYDVDDLFDEVATDALLKQQMKKGNYKLSFKKKVRVSCVNLNPIVSRNSIAKKVKAIRKSLLEISSDMTGLSIVPRGKEEEVPNDMGREKGCFVDAKEVIGRDEDKKAILEILLNESYDANSVDSVVVIAIVGIGGMGKTTLAQLIYNDDEVKGNFEKRWFACISDISDEKEVLGKIFQSICEGEYTSLTVSQLQNKIRESIKGKKFVLVLDDVWDDDHDRWPQRMKLLSGGARGSRIIITTRSMSVEAAVGALKAHELGGLSDDYSWDLFKRVAFAPENENDTRRIYLGREIVKKCRNVPLAIRSIGSLLFEKKTIQEWECIGNEELRMLRRSHENGIMPVLKLSYDHLPSTLKQCFAYCALFPKDYNFNKMGLIYLWIAQGYVEENNEDVGHSHFMYLLRRGFFQEPEENAYGEIESCKMHDLIHDLAQHVAGLESFMVTASSNTSNCTRHVSIGDSWDIPASLLNVNGLRSFLLLNNYSICKPTLLDQIANFKLLRTLRLPNLGIGNVPSSIGELKHLRYLDLSGNRFTILPDSLTNLLNLLTLDIKACWNLKALPKDLKKLINLMYLNIDKCPEVKHMPGGVGEMSCLKYLSDFKVGKPAISVVKEGVAKRSGLDELATLQHQLRGKLSIKIEDGIDEEEVWDEDESRWQLPVSPHELHIIGFPCRGIADWGINVNINISGGISNNLAVLEIEECEKLKYLPPLRCLPNLKKLTLRVLVELEYVEEEEENESIHNNASSSIFFPSLKVITFSYLPKVKGWRRNVASNPPQFTRLSNLDLTGCPELELKSFPPCPCLRELVLCDVDDNEVIQEQGPSTIFGCSSSVSLSSPAYTFPPAIEEITIVDCKWLGSFHSKGIAFLGHLNLSGCSSLKSVHLESPHLHTICIRFCDELMSLELQIEPPTTSFRLLEIRGNKQLKKLHIPAAHLNALEELWIAGCPELKLWDSPDESHECHLDWDSLTNLRELRLDPLSLPEKIPNCLRQRRALGQLAIQDEYGDPISFDSDGKCILAEHSSEEED